jgi:hypothetical protein
VIEDIFKDCESIADKYETKLIDVVLRYAQIERKYQNRDIDHKKLLEKTEEHFKVRYDGRRQPQP